MRDITKKELKWYLKLISTIDKLYFPNREGFDRMLGWMDMLERWGPSYFLTMTHEQQRNRRQWMRILERIKVQAWKEGMQIEIFYVFEDNERGGQHVHGLVKVFGDAKVWHELVKICDKIGGGRNRLDILKGTGGIWYVLKYMFKGRGGQDDNYGFI